MKSPTYATLVLLVFIRNLSKGECSSIRQLIQITDKLLKKLGFEDTLSYMTKYYVIKELLEQGVLQGGDKKYSIPISLSETTKNYIAESLSDVIV